MGGRGLRVRATMAREVVSSLFATVLLSLSVVSHAAEPKASAASSIPLPPDTQIVTPAKDIALEIAGFSGKWTGVWDGTLEHVLVVEQINPPDASVIYGYGEAQSWGKANFKRVQGHIDECTLTLSLSRPATVTYRLRSDNYRLPSEATIDATYEWSGGTSRALLKRVERAPGDASEGATIGCASVTRPVISKLPARLKGWYRFKSSVDFNEYAQTTEFEIASQDDSGNITGFFSFALPRWGTRPDALCSGANRLPMTGSYDGDRITLSIKGSQNGPGCQDYTRMFNRAKDHYFDRKANDNSWSWYYDAVE